MVLYDKAEWQSGGPHPDSLPPANKGTHIGMFLAWAILNDLASPLLRERFPEALRAVQERRMTGREFLAHHCSNELGEDALSAEGNGFAKTYYTKGNRMGYGIYLQDYKKVLAPRIPSLYRVADTWENFDLLAPLLSRRFLNWKEKEEDAQALRRNPFATLFRKLFTLPDRP